jgi:hypothetical protein
MPHGKRNSGFASIAEAHEKYMVKHVSFAGAQEAGPSNVRVYRRATDKRIEATIAVAVGHEPLVGILRGRYESDAIC